MLYSDLVLSVPSTDCLEQRESITRYPVCNWQIYLEWKNYWSSKEKSTPSSSILTLLSSPTNVKMQMNMNHCCPPGWKCSSQAPSCIDSQWGEGKLKALNISWQEHPEMRKKTFLSSQHLQCSYFQTHSLDLLK